MKTPFTLKYKNSAFPFKTGDDDAITKLEKSLESPKQKEKVISGGGGIDVIPSHTMTSSKISDVLPKGVSFGGGGTVKINPKLSLSAGGSGHATKGGVKISPDISLTRRGKKGSFTIGGGKRGFNISKTWNL